jgi:hypothetical protein
LQQIPACNILCGASGNGSAEPFMNSTFLLLVRLNDQNGHCGIRVHFDGGSGAGHVECG